ncbi:acid phosphatase [Nocardioides baekrokdamisoli]|uniref:Acid phosphatase n=1 Tax=Nocardioides baekrokdamisoli TaxID=1804624 RepID=A0A3G9J4X5_9ACTN|nr:alkaline phosphatase family protein [Nocardioides baekrokdamisoli]BBH18039.1 acid phosphatase [Nocardioides baekrokdamisoli]
MRIRILLLALVLLAGCGVPSAGPAPTHPTVELTAASPYGHVFVIVLENEDAAQTFSTSSPAVYLNRWIKPRSVFVPNYYGIGHHSLDNYIAMISGQAPNTKTQADCPTFAAYTSSTIGANGQVQGTGCVYPSNVPTVAKQLAGAGRTWRAYLDGMQTACQHPAIGARDPNQGETAATAYATKHNPFVYFRSISAATCASNDVPLTHLAADLGSVASTRNLSYIVPDLCNDGHDTTCPYGRGPGGLTGADAWLHTWVPKILNSPAYKQDGLLIITFDEAGTDSRACCHEVAGPGASMPGLNGPGGGRVGAVMMSPRLSARTIAGGYNHYSLLATIEHIFGVPRLGFAAPAAPLA